MAFAADHQSAAVTACLAVSRQRASSQDRFWTQHWVPFTDELGLDPFLATVEDKVPVLRVLTHQIRDGRASCSGQPVQAERVRDVILAIVKGFTNMGLPDPCLTSYGDMDPHLTNLYTSYKNADLAPPHIMSSPYRSKSSTVHRPLVAHLPRPRPPSTWPGLIISIFSGPASIARPQRILHSRWRMSPSSSVPPALHCSPQPQRT